MANPDTRFGLRPVKHLNGNPWNGMTLKCYISSLYATALYIGDPVDLDTTLLDKDPTAKCHTVIRATLADGNFTIGPIVAFEPNRDNLSRIYIPASTGGYCYVAADPDLLFEIRDDGATLLTSVVVGQNAIMISTHAGSTLTGLSGIELDTTADPPAADASNMLLIHGLADYPDNELAIHAVWQVSINMHRFRATGDANGSLGVTAA